MLVLLLEQRLATRELLLVLDKGERHLVSHDAVAAEVFYLATHLRHDFGLVGLRV